MPDRNPHDWKQQVRNQLVDLSLSPTREAEIVEELAQHLSDRYDELLASGVTEEQAYRTALGELAAHELVLQLRRVEHAETHPPSLGENSGRNIFSTLYQDLRYASRLLRKNPSFTLVAIVSLALGIGANTAIFQLLDAVRLRSLPVRDPQQLAIIDLDRQGWSSGDFRGEHSDLTFPLWEQIKANQQGFSDVLAWGNIDLNLTPGGEMHLAHSILVTGGFFQTLGITPMLGRVLNESDDVKGCGSGPAVLSYPFWTREFGGDPAAIGRKLMLDGHPFEIAGVTPPSFFGVDVGKTFDVALPMCSEPLLKGEKSGIDSPRARTEWWMGAMGRLKPGWTLQRASAQLNAASLAMLEATLPPQYEPAAAQKYMRYRARAKAGGTGFSNLRQNYEDPLWLLLGIAGLVLLIACANLANLMLARATAREREIAIRLALGANRWRLMRQLLTESLLLAFVGAACGMLLANVISRFLVSFLDTQGDPIFMTVSTDWRVLGFTTALAVLTCILFGLTPALRATRTAPSVAMAAGGRNTGGKREGFGLRRGLVVSQVALSLVLVVTAVLFVRSLTKLMNVDAGFRRDGILVAQIDLTQLNIPAAQRIEFKRQLLSRISAVPQVQSAASTDIIPATNDVWNNGIIVDDKQKLISDITQVTPGYFKTMGMSLIMGRDFDERDTPTSQKTVIVNQKFVQKVFDGQDAIGKTFRIHGSQGEMKPLLQVVGVVRDTKYSDLRDDFKPIVFLPASQDELPGLSQQLVIHFDGAPNVILEQVKETLRNVNPQIAVQFHLFSSQIRDQLLRERLLATLSGLFGILAGALAVVGIYGVISYMVARRTNEIGIRMALGANGGDIVRMIMREAGMLLSFGLALGTALAFVAARWASSLLYGLKPSDPPTYLSAIATLTCVTIAASFLPARRAALLDPMVALRDE